jgi:hypothetical protein
MKFGPLKSRNIRNTSRSSLRRRRGAFLTIILLSAFFSGQANGGTVAFQAIATSDNVYTELVSVTVEGRPAVAVANMIGIDVFHFFASANGPETLTTSTNVLGPNTVDPPPINTRAALLDNDIWLNTGIINVASGTGIVQGASPTSSSPGIGVNFLTPVINGAGDEIVLFDHTPNLTGSGDSFVVTFLAQGIGYGAHSMGFTTIPDPPDPFIESPYSDPFQILLGKSYRQSNPVSNLEEHLEVKPLTAVFLSPNAVQSVRAVSFDLSSVGIPLGDSVTGLFIQSTSMTVLVDPVFIAGLDVIVPEPSATTIILSALVALTSARRRIRRI